MHGGRWPSAAICLNRRAHAFFVVTGLTMAVAKIETKPATATRQKLSLVVQDAVRRWFLEMQSEAMRCVVCPSSLSPATLPAPVRPDALLTVLAPAGVMSSHRRCWVKC